MKNMNCPFKKKRNQSFLRRILLDIAEELTAGGVGGNWALAKAQLPTHLLLTFMAVGNSGLGKSSVRLTKSLTILGFFFIEYDSLILLHCEGAEKCISCYY